MSSNSIPSDQLTNPDAYDLNANDYLGTNLDGVVTGLKRVVSPTLATIPATDGAKAKVVAADSGIFRRHETCNYLVSGSDSFAGDLDRPLPDYLDGTAGSMFDRALLAWPNLGFYGVRIRNPETRLFENKFKFRTLTSMNGLATNLAKALLAYNLVEEREFTDEGYLHAQKLRTIVTMMPNREEFHILDQACNKGKIAMVPTYASLGIDGCKAIFNEVQASSLITDFNTLKKLTSVKGSKSGSYGLDTLILVDTIEGDLTKRELNYFIEETEDYNHLMLMMEMLGIKYCVRFSTLLTFGSTIRDATNYDNSRLRPANVYSEEVYINSAFDVGADAREYWLESPFGKIFIEKRRRKESVAFDQVVAEDVQTICYTSGTTGMPKGVLTTHQMLTSVAVGATLCPFSTKGMELGLLKAGNHITESPDMTFSILPLVHAYERLITSLCYTLGIQISMFSQNISKLTEEMKIVKPTIIVGVPRIFQRIINGIDDQSMKSSFVVKSIYETGVIAKQYYAERGLKTHLLWDRMIFNRIKENVTGNRLKLLLTGAAPMSASVQYRCEGILSTNLIEGYGLTESMGGVCVRLNGDAKGFVGTVLPSVEIKLEAVPDMNIDDVREEMKGELCVRGHSITPGYFRREDLNKEAFKDGWFHTGDIAQIRGGLVAIKDRKKAIFKLMQGEYISPEKLEVFLESIVPWIETILVTGRSTSRFAVALIVPSKNDVPGWKEYAASKGGSIKNNIKDSTSPGAEIWESFLTENYAEIKAHFLETQESNLKLYDIQGFERVMNIHLIPYAITAEALVTPTLKLKRNQVRNFFENEISTLCDEIDQEN